MAFDQTYSGKNLDRPDELWEKIARRVEVIRERVARAASRAGRDPARIQILAASKSQPPNAIRAAYDAGLRIFGENYVQEALQKRAELSDLADAKWHLIGHLQRNKARAAAESFELIHSLDSYELAQRLARLRSNPPAEVLIEVNLGKEATKNGVMEEDVECLLERINGLVTVRGLMVIPPPGPTAEHSRPYFARLRQLRDELQRATGLALPELSMGMSRDFEVAIEEGATIVRIGEAIFGERPE